MNITSFIANLASKRQKKAYTGVSDFLLHASPKEKLKMFKRAAEKANEDQQRIMEAAKMKP